jgi:hypothetical protein
VARDPGSLWSPLPEDGHQGTYAKNAVIIHSTGDRGSAAAIFRYFSRADVVVESTFVIGLSAADPTRQLLDSNATADANMSANQRAISIEVVGQAGDDYTDWQVGEILRICRWAIATHKIPLRICANPDDAGFGWHVMFGAPGPWAAVAKVCPGPVRVQRLQRDIFPALFAAAAPAPAPTSTEDDDMPLFIRSHSGTIAIITDAATWVPDGESNLGLQAKYGKPAQVSDAFYNTVTAAANSDETLLGTISRQLDELKALLAPKA